MLLQPRIPDSLRERFWRQKQVDPDYTEKDFASATRSHCRATHVAESAAK